MRIYNAQPKIIAKSDIKSQQRPPSDFIKPVFTPSFGLYSKPSSHSVRNRVLGGLNVNFKGKLTRKQIEENRRIAQQITGPKYAGNSIGTKDPADWNPASAEFLNKLNKKHPTIYSSIKKSIPEILKDKKLKAPLLERNLEILEKIISTNEFSGLVDNQLHLTPEFLTFQGDLERFCKIYEEKMDDSSFWFGRLKTQFHKDGKLEIRDTKGFPNYATQIYDKKMTLISSEEVFNKRLSSGKCITETIINDIKNNTQYSMNQANSLVQGSVLQNMTTTIKDKSGRIISQEILSPSSVKGAYNIKRINKNGVIEDLSFAVENENGLKIKKKLPSLNGEITYFDYFQNKEKTFEEFHYVIKDKSQNILAQTHSSLKRISETSFESTVDGVKYEVEHFGDGHIKIHNHKTNKITEFQISLEKEYKTEFENLLKTLSGEELEKFDNSIRRIEYPKDGCGFMSPETRMLETISDKAVLTHEAAHGKRIPIDGGRFLYNFDEFFAKNKEFQKIYKEELALIEKSLPAKFRKIIYYFIKEIKNDNGIKTSPLCETAAEINTLINSPVFLDKIQDRTHLLQRYFQRTIAFVINHRV